MKRRCAYYIVVIIKYEVLHAKQCGESGYRGLLQVMSSIFRIIFPFKRTDYHQLQGGSPVAGGAGCTVCDQPDGQVALSAPPLELSLEPGDSALLGYNLRVEAEGFDPLVVSGTEILAIPPRSSR